MITIGQTTERDVTVLQLHGRITLGRSVQELEGRVDELIQAQVKRVVLDLADVSFIDSTTIGTFVMCSGKLKKSGGSLRLSGATGVVKQTLTLCRINSIVPLLPTVEEAAASFTAAGGPAQGATAFPRTA